MKTAIVGWSGNGDLRDLKRTAAAKLSPLRVKVSPRPASVLVLTDDPVAVASRLEHLPGVAWVAVGFEFRGEAQLYNRLETLAKRYLREGSSFSLRVRAEESRREEGDLLLEGTGTVLKTVEGSRVDEKSPEVIFRALMVRDSGAVGVQLRKGPGGVPTSSASAVCLVSGGYHSAVAAWMAALAGYRVTLVHSWSDDESLRQVARLYAELSHRVDSSGLALEVLSGEGSPGGRLARWLDGARGEVMAGTHPECRGLAVRKKFAAYPSALSPLLLLSEEDVRVRFDSLGLKRKVGDSQAELKMGGRTSSYQTKRFGGKEADISGVLDSILA